MSFTLRISLSNSAPDGVISMEFAKNSILNEETRRKSQGVSSSSDVLVTESRGRSLNRDPKEKNKIRSKSNKFANLECHYCHKKGHMKKDCWKLKKDNKKGKQRENNEERVAVTTEEFLVMLEEEVINLACHETSWVIDSGASIHATSRREFFATYTPSSFGSVKMGNDGLAQVVGIGDVCLDTSHGTRLVLKNVKHIPDVRLNLISAGRLDDEGFCSTFSGGKWKLTKGSMVVARGTKSASLYLMHAKLSKDDVNALENVDVIELWHKRLDHMSEK